MTAIAGRTLRAAAAAGFLRLAACSSTTTLQSDLHLDGSGSARIKLRQQTQTMELSSDGAVRVVVLDKKKRIISDLFLNARDKVQLDLTSARYVDFFNEGYDDVVVQWTMRNDDRIEYDLALNPHDD